MATDWPAMVREFGPIVWKTAQRLLRNEADVSDCFQETFLSAFEFSQRQPVTNWPGLLQRIATARALDQLRRRSRDRTVGDEGLCDSHPSSGPRPDQQSQADDLNNWLRRALTQLPPQQSQAFCMRHLNELDYSEIASEMGITVDAVGALLHRARKRLGELLVGAASVDLNRR